MVEMLVVKPLPRKVGNFVKVAGVFSLLIKYQHSEKPMGAMKIWLPVLFAQLRGISSSLLFIACDWQCCAPTRAVDSYFSEEQYYL